MSRLVHFVSHVFMGLFLFFCCSIILLHTDSVRSRLCQALELYLSHHFDVALSIERISLINGCSVEGISLSLPSGHSLRVERCALRDSLVQSLSSGEIRCDVANFSSDDFPPLQGEICVKCVDSEGICSLRFYEDTEKKRCISEGEIACEVRRRYGIPYAVVPEAPIRGKFSADLPLDLVGNPLLPDTCFISGDVHFSCSLSGTLERPLYSGHGRLVQGYCEVLSSGAVFFPVEISFDCFEEGLTLRRLHARDSSGGTIEGSGYMKLSNPFPFDVVLRCDRAALFHSDEIEGKASGDLTLTGDRWQSRLEGELAVERLDIFLPERRSEQIEAMRVTYIEEESSPAIPCRRKHSRSPPLLLNIALSLPSVSIADDRLESRWHGKLWVTGAAPDPEVEGKWDVINGSYLFNGKKWRIREGKIAFSGKNGTESQLYFAAEFDIDDACIEIIVKGRFDDLHLDFRSSPSMSQREILSRILFGRGLKEISSFQGVELSRSINKLQEIDAKGDDVFKSIRERFSFIDRIDIVKDSSADGEEVSLTVGSYIFPRLFVGVKKNFHSKAGGIEIEAHVTENIKLQAEIGDREEHRIHLKWKKDY